MTKEKMMEAAKAIEADGVDGFETATKIVGRDIAVGMLIVHLRANFGGRNSQPAKPSIDGAVYRSLDSEGITIK